MKKKLVKENSEDRIVRRLGVLLEQIRSEVQTVAEGHGVLDNKIVALDKKMDAAGKKLDDKIGAVDKKIDAVHQTLQQDIQRLAKSTQAGFDRLESTLGHVLNDHEKRVQKLEDKIAV